tara:strand:- start:315 stop:1052 length:738 start_codon:yes stop_codon:yes gene_type:complete
MKKILLLITFLSSFAFGQDYDYQQLCLDCAAAEGFYCGDDPSNWTQYAPLGCVQNSWINDGWIDCVDASDEGVDVVPTLPLDCIPPPPLCDTIYVDVPVYIYETIFQTDTIYNTEYITQIVIDTVEVETFVPEYIFQTDTLWMEGALDTMFIDVIEYVDIFVFDTIIETEYVEFFTTDTIIEFVEIINTEYLDCDTGMPCGESSILEIIETSKTEKNKIFTIEGKEINRRYGLYIENGNINYKLK